MAKFDAEIAWCSDQIKQSEKLFDDFDRGERWFRGIPGQVTDVTDKHRAIEKKRIENMKKLIAAYRAINH